MGVASRHRNVASPRGFDPHKFSQQKVPVSTKETGTIILWDLYLNTPGLCQRVEIRMLQDDAYGAAADRRRVETVLTQSTNSGHPNRWQEAYVETL